MKHTHVSLLGNQATAEQLHLQNRNKFEPCLLLSHFLTLCVLRIDARDVAMWELIHIEQPRTERLSVSQYTFS
jgi:hypothetical protein